MKLEQQVCSLELARKIKKLNVKQESLFYWVFPESKNRPLIYYGRYDNAFNFSNHGEVYSAFTVAELFLLRGVMSVKTNSGFCCQQSFGFEEINLGLTMRELWEITKSDTEADARAKMLIYLLENRVIINELIQEEIEIKGRLGESL